MASKTQTLLLLLVATLTVALFHCTAVSTTSDGQKNDKVDGVMSWQVVDRPEQDPNLQDLAQYAVAAHNAVARTKLQYVGVVSCKHQDGAAGIIQKVVVIKCVDGGVTKTYEANVWVKPWIKYRKLISFQVLV